MDKANEQKQPLQPSSVDQTAPLVKKPQRSKKIVFISALSFILLLIGGYYLLSGQLKQESQNSDLTVQPSISPSSPTVVAVKENKSIFLTLKSGIPFDVIVKSARAQVLGESTGGKKSIPVQIFAFEDNNGNGVREPDDAALGFMPVNIYDSPFSTNPINKINSTDSGWASALVQVDEPYQLVVNPVPTKEYYPTTKPIIVSEKNNFAVVGFQKKQEVSFHISIFAFEDTNKDGNFNYDDRNEKPLFLAPFKFYQQNESGGWDLLPNSVNSTDIGWATTTLGVKYPYVVKIEAGDTNTLTPSNKEIATSYDNATLIFPYIGK